MDVGRRKGGGVRSSSVVPGSVWESRMKSDEVRGGIKVFNGEEESKDIEGGEDGGGPRLRRISNGKRKTWKLETSEGFDRSMIHVARRRSSDTVKSCDEQLNKGVGVCLDGSKKVPIFSRKIASSVEKSERNNKVMRKVRSETVENNVGVVDDDNDDLVCKDLDLCQEKVMSCSSENVGVDIFVDFDDEDGEEIKVEKESVKEINVSEVKAVNETLHKKGMIHKPASMIRTARQSSPIKRHSSVNHNLRKSHSIPKAEKQHGFPQTCNKLHSLVDLIMWREVSRSAFVFGIGTFIVLSSSYAVDINVSSISVMSYLALANLAVIFLYRSFIYRGVINFDSKNNVLGEEEAIWLVKLILPYLNEFLLILRALFSGDPGTTMKMAVLLFVLARWGSSITIWKMAKFGFFVVFMVPKLYSLYSAQLTSYVNSWVNRVREGWDSCGHKKAVGLGIFGLVWNLSSVVVRIWAVFVLIAALRYYQQNKMARDECGEEELEEEETKFEVGVESQRQGHGLTFPQTNKLKKAF